MLAFTRDAFPYALIFYLALFLLENLFPGFVSNNFSLNWILGVVLALGLLAVCSPDKQEKSEDAPVGRNDYLLVAGLALIGGAIIFAKLEVSPGLRWITAFVSGGLIVLVGFVVLTGIDEEPEKLAEIPEEISESRSFPHVRWQKVWQNLTYLMRPFFIKEVRLPLSYVLIFVLITAFLIPKNIATLADALRRPTPELPVETQELTSTAEPFFWDDMNEFVPIQPSDNLPISVLNGGGDRGAASTFSALLRDNGFGHVTVGNADRYNYTNAQIRFAETDKPQANIIKQLLLKEYSMVLELPAEATFSGITVILGTKEKAQ